MEVRIFLLADYANRELSGKLNVLGAFNRIAATGFPVLHKTMYLVIRLSADLWECDVEHDFSIVFSDQDGNELNRQTGKIVIGRPELGAIPEIDFIVEVNGLQLPKPNRYEFRLILNKEVKAIIPLDVIQIPEE